MKGAVILIPRAQTQALRQKEHLLLAVRVLKRSWQGTSEPLQPKAIQGCVKPREIRDGFKTLESHCYNKSLKMILEKPTGSRLSLHFSVLLWLLKALNTGQNGHHPKAYK